MGGELQARCSSVEGKVFISFEGILSNVPPVFSLAGPAVTKQPKAVAGYFKGGGRSNPLFKILDHTFLNFFHLSTVKADQVMMVILMV